jgi:3-oxoacyl-(acyl-carrier-protein) synthase
MTNIVITGLGVVSPYGVGLEPLWENICAGNSALSPLTAFDTSHLQCRVGGQISNFTPTAYLSSRTIRKLDRFSIYGLIAAQQALQHAGLLLDNQKPLWSASPDDSTRVGLTVGNNLGGWEFAERELRHLWQDGPRAVSPYMATAWFPAAVQGNISIQFGIKGVGRTFLADRASGALAIFHAADCLRRGRADIMLAGGTEAPFSPYAALCYETSGIMSKQAVNGSSGSYRPFDRAHDGLVAGEGSAFFVLERADDALKRGATILAELTGWSVTHDGFDAVQPAPDGKRFSVAMTRALEKAQITADDVDCLFTAGSAVPIEDVTEVAAVHQTFGAAVSKLPVSTPKSAFGNLFGAAFPMDVAVAIRAMQEHTIPGALNFSQGAEGCDLDFVVSSPRVVDHLNTCLLNGRGIGGTNAALVLQRSGVSS